MRLLIVTGSHDQAGNACFQAARLGMTGFLGQVSTGMRRGLTIDGSNAVTSPGTSSGANLMISVRSRRIRLLVCGLTAIVGTTPSISRANGFGWFHQGGLLGFRTVGAGALPMGVSTPVVAGSGLLPMGLTTPVVAGNVAGS